MTMRERVADEIRMYLIGDEVTARLVADAAITAVIEALAAEAEALEDTPRDPFFCGQSSGDYSIALDVADWLRAHLSTRRDGTSEETSQ